MPRMGGCATPQSDLPDVSAEEIDKLVAWDTQVAEEDVALVEAVQRGLDSGMVPQGRLMTGASS